MNSTFSTTPPNRSEWLARLDEAAVGYAGVEGAWWLPSLAPFDFGPRARRLLEAAGQAIAALCACVAELAATPAGAAAGLDALLRHKVPAHLMALHSRAPVLGVRPDFQIVAGQKGGLERFVATELEICPSAQGFAHAMQHAYGLPTDLADACARLLGGRTLLFVTTGQWSEFLFEQAGFCRALEERGASGRVLLDLPLAEIDRSVQAGERWRPPLFGIDREPPGWDPRVLRRLEARGLRRFVDDSVQWPERLPETVVFRFGYLDCFAPEHLRQLVAWESQGVQFLNPCSFVYDSKCLMAAARLPGVRAWLAERFGAEVPDLLDEVLPETLLLTAETAQRIAQERPQWVLKYAGFDGGDLVWGGRSLRVGALVDDAAWSQTLRQALALRFPVVAQRYVPSLQLTAEYLRRDGPVGQMVDGTSRLRAFFMRGGEEDPTCCGVHVTLANGVLVSEGSSSVQGPVRFVGQERGCTGAT